MWSPMGAEVLPCPLDCMEQVDMGMHHILMADPLREVLGSKANKGGCRTGA